jgi:tetratricopeptide (TPR) repeat protein
MPADRSSRSELSARWQRMIASGELSTIRDEAGARLNDTGQIDTAFLLNWQAVAYNQLGMHNEASQCASIALSNVGDDDHELIARIYSNIAAALLGLGKAEEALSAFETAEAILHELGSDWALSAVLINHATGEFARRNFAGGLALLDKAVNCSPEPDTDQAQIALRHATIRVNRSSALFQLGRTQDSINELLAARQQVLALGDSSGTLRGTVDLNLATTYLRLHLYGSMLEAAESAARAFTEFGHEPMKRRARYLVASAQAELGKYGSAQEIIDELLSTAEEGSEEIVHLSKAADAFRRQQGIWQMGTETETEGESEAKIISKRLDELQDEGYAGPAYKESEILLARLDELADHPAAKLAAKFMRAIRDAYADPENSQKLRHELTREAEEIAGPRIRGISGVIRGFAAEASGSTEEQLDNWLELLWNLHGSWHDQHDETYRSDFLETADSLREITTALQLAADAEKPTVIMEIIETFRVDVSHLPLKVSYLGLPEFYRLAEAGVLDHSSPDFGKEDKHETAATSGRVIETSLTPIAIRGISAIAEAASVTQVAVDIDSLRVAQAGESALWWSFNILGQNLYWALLGPDFVYGGTRKVPTKFSGAVKTHLATLPIPHAADFALLKGSEPPSVARLLALARCASTAALGRPDIRDAAIAALPKHLRTSARAYCTDAEEIDVRSAYEQIAEVLLSDELRRTIVAARGDGRLIVTLPPELATVPISLLPTGHDSIVLDHASVQFAPPPGLAAQLVGRTSGETPRPHLLAVVDTTGDLASAGVQRSTPVAQVLTGWANARNVGEIASRERIEKIFRDTNWLPSATGVISYIGHIMPGSRDRPGSAALLCAPTSETDRPGLLTAREILSWGPSFPSHFYLGGCEGTGFGTGLEWASVATAALAKGAACVLAHAWPIVDCSEMAQVDRTCVGLLSNAADVGQALVSEQRSWWSRWQRGLPDAIPPHFWAGLQLAGRSCS